MGPRISYANVTSTLALVIALSGGAYAVTTLPTNSVGTAQLKTGAVTNAKIGASAVTGAKVLNGSLTLSDLKPGTVLRNRGAWSATTAYVPNDVVQSGGASYVARLANTNVPTNNTTNWAVLAAKGAQGPAGPTQAVTGVGSSFVFVPLCTATTLASTTVTPTVNSRVFVSASGYWTPNGNAPAGHPVQNEIVVLDGATTVGRTQSTYASGPSGVNDDVPISTSGVVLTSPISSSSTPVTLSAGTTYTIQLRMDIAGTCTGGAQYFSSVPEVSAVLTADQG